MRTDARLLAGGVYRPRNPRVRPVYQCVRLHDAELGAAGLVHRPVEAEVLERFLSCGDLHDGFARPYSDQCSRDYLLAYSCKTRYFCPSCHLALYSRFLHSASRKGAIEFPILNSC